MPGFIVGTLVAGSLGGVTGAIIGGLAAGVTSFAFQSLIGRSKQSPQGISGQNVDNIGIARGREGEPINRIFGTTLTGGQVLWISEFPKKIDSEAIERVGGTGRETRETPDEVWSVSLAIAFGEGGANTLIGNLYMNGILVNIGTLAERPETVDVLNGDPDQPVSSLLQTLQQEDYVKQQAASAGARFRNNYQTAPVLDADGNPVLDENGVAMREVVTPAYRNTAYVVIRDLPVFDFGNQVPYRIEAEIQRPPFNVEEDSLQAGITAATMLPGFGEFTYATSDIIVDDGFGNSSSRTLNADVSVSDIRISLRDMNARFRNVESVMFPVEWYADMDAGGVVKPGVDSYLSESLREIWFVSDVNRYSEIPLLTEGRGTPSDASIVQFIDYLAVDVDANGLSSPKSVIFSPRLRPMNGEIAYTDSFFGDTSVDDFRVRQNQLTFLRDRALFDYRRMILHYAYLCVIAHLQSGADISHFLVGHRLKGVTLHSETEELDAPDFSQRSFPTIMGVPGQSRRIAFKTTPAQDRASSGEVGTYFGNDFFEIGGNSPVQTFETRQGLSATFSNLAPGDYYLSGLAFTTDFDPARINNLYLVRYEGDTPTQAYHFLTEFRSVLDEPLYDPDATSPSIYWNYVGADQADTPFRVGQTVPQPTVRVNANTTFRWEYLANTRTTYPGAEAMAQLVRDARSVFRNYGMQTKVSYLADADEYGAQIREDWSGVQGFPLDAVWREADFVAVFDGNPKGDWRDDPQHEDLGTGEVSAYNIDSGNFQSESFPQGQRNYERGYIRGQVKGGEHFHYRYASRADRISQARTIIQDPNEGKHWVFRRKDFRNWMFEPHSYVNADGSRVGDGFVPQKPIMFVNACRAIDKATNDPVIEQPDIPPFSTGIESDLMQRRCHEVVNSVRNGDNDSRLAAIEQIAIREAEGDRRQAIMDLEENGDPDNGIAPVPEESRTVFRDINAAPDLSALPAEKNDDGEDNPAFAALPEATRNFIEGVMRGSRPSGDDLRNEDFLSDYPEAFDFRLPQFLGFAENPGRELILEANVTEGWDARPHPFFPAFSEIWSDTAQYPTGFSISGRVGVTNLSEFVTDLAVESGLREDQIDASGLRNELTPFNGYLASELGSAADLLDPLQTAYFFDMFESEGRIVAKYRHDTTVTDIPLSDLIPTQQLPRGLRMMRRHDPDIVDLVTLSYFDRGNRHSVANSNARSNTIVTNKKANLELPISLSKEEADAICRIMQDEQEQEREEGEYNLPLNYSFLDPGDLIRVDGRLQKITFITQGETLQVQTISASGTIYDRVLGTASQTRSPVIRPIGRPRAFALDAPLYETESGAPLRFLLGAYQNPFPRFVRVLRADGGAGGLIQSPTLIGNLRSIGTTGSRFTLDHKGFIDVQLHRADAQLESVTDAELLRSGLNRIVAIETAQGFIEMKMFGRADFLGTENGLPVYRLSKLLHGVLGTNRLIAPHPTRSRVYFPNLASLRTYIPPSDELFDRDEELRFVPSGVSLADIDILTRAVTRPAIEQVANNPPPAHLKKQILENGDIRWSWVRRAYRGLGLDGFSSAVGRSRDGDGAYRWRILDSDFEELHKGETTDTQYTFTVAEQMAHGGIRNRHIFEVSHAFRDYPGQRTLLFN